MDLKSTGSKTGNNHTIQNQNTSHHFLREISQLPKQLPRPNHIYTDGSNQGMNFFLLSSETENSERVCQNNFAEITASDLIMNITANYKSS